MLTSALRALVNNLFLKSFNTIFMKNEKKKKTIKMLIVFFFFFFIKIFFKLIINQCPKNIY